ncbi:MAG TPA: aldose epimerase family protein [Longimicrobium sp.]|nr:aldose epimerase family protein [Longimicrobium sp.]
MPPIVSRSPFGRLPGGEQVELFELHSTAGVVVRVSGYGGIIQSLLVPDRHGNVDDVVLGFDRLEQYVGDQGFFGALIGRYANRIRGGRFRLDGRDYTLPANDHGNHLHGGPGGFHKVCWHVKPFSHEDGVVGLRLTRVSPHGEQGYPGRLDAEVTYTLDSNELAVDYVARTDRPTPVCLTQHTYFNLAADPSIDVLEHRLELGAARFTPVDDTLIPTGELASVEGTPFDFRAATPIGERIGADHPQLALSAGYDHNFVLDGHGGAPVRAARVHEPGSGRVLEVWTTEPGLQFYSGNYLDGSVRGKGGRRYGHHAGFCLEPQHFPDSPNRPDFPPCILRPGERYHSRTVYRFGVDTGADA